MKKPLLSVCIPVYNAGHYLGQCLDSVIRQTLQDIEIICIPVEQNHLEDLAAVSGEKRHYRKRNAIFR